MSVSLLKLTSLDSIRGFVAVGRRMSITLAAQDLCLTQSAVSRQIHVLEAMLGVRLFIRGHRSIAFTPEGERLFRSADSAVQQLQDVIGNIRGIGAIHPVTVTTTIGVASLWFLPRLGAFLQQHPGIDVRVSASNRLCDLRAEGLDLAIRYGAQEILPEGALRLFGETVTPVAHPSLGITALDSPDVLATQFLLEYDGPYRPALQWSDWLANHGWEQVKPKGVLRFNQYDLVIQAAIAGQGIALGRLELVSAMLADGRLTALRTAQQSPPSAHAYWLIQADPAPRTEVQEVIRWIKSEAGNIDS